VGDVGDSGTTEVEARRAPAPRVATEGRPEVIVIDLRGVEPTERSEVLGLVATKVRERLREDDVVAPLGGDQLGVVFRGLPQSTIESLKRRIAGVFDEPLVTATGRVRRLEGSVTSLTAEAPAPSIELAPAPTAAPASAAPSARITRPTRLARPGANAPRDALTSLLTPRALAPAVAALTGPYVVALIDVDGFGAINTCLGLAGGDGILVQVATLLTDSRGDDLVCRWGGQQFLVVMPRVSVEGAAARIERLLVRTMAQVRVSVRPVSFCAGIAASQPGEGLDDAVREAERSLRTAKARGRGTVLVGDRSP
jgi:diguanylate cyclase (GGDEF)-like protein